MREANSHTYEFGPFQLDPAERRLLRDGQPVSLTPKAFDTLVLLVERAGHLVEKEVLMNALWPDSFVEEANLAQHVWTLRKTLGETDNGGPFIETVSRKGFRFVAPVIKHQLDEVVGADEQKNGHAQAEKTETSGQISRVADLIPSGSGSLLSSRKILIVLLAAGTLGLVGYGLSTLRTATAPSRVKTIAVLPFKPLSSDSRNESLEMGMAETLITRLSNLRQIVVRPMSAVSKYNELQQDPIKAGQELQTDLVLDGSIQKADERVRVTVRLMNVRNGTTLWAQQFDENFTDIFKVQDSISTRVTNSLPLRLSGDEERRLSKHSTDNAEAYQLYLQGEYLFNKRRYDESLNHYQRAAEKDPNFALAYIGIAQSHIFLSSKQPQEAVSRARAALTKALELDNTLAEAYSTQADISYVYEYDWPRAEKDYQKAIELNPNVPQIHLAYGRYLMKATRFDEAMPQFERAQELDPLNFRIKIYIGLFLYFTRQYDKALEYGQKLLEVEPNDFNGFELIAHSYEQKGMYAESVEFYLESWVRSGTLKPEEVEGFKKILKESGWKGFIQAMRVRFEEKCKTEQCSPTFMAQLYARLGDKDRAFAWLDKAIDERDALVVMLKIEPSYDSLRSDPRYPKVLTRMNLSP